jgi:hypothetical protein|tara:strand:+ start:861 stop:1523 length:663 start_codon:yes stop_codon:yes gene_type:complete
MATSIPPVDGAYNVKHCMLIDLTLDDTTYYLSSAFKPITHNGNSYTELGAFLQISNIIEDIKTTNGDLNISLSGIPSEADYLSEVLNTPIKGGVVKLSRAFFEDDYSVSPSNIFQRFSGIITNFAIEEQEDIIAGDLSTTITVQCASIVTILENKISGQRTNPTDRNKFYAGDGTWNRVPQLQNVAFDFGRDFAYTGGTGGGGGWGGGFGGPGGINFNMR